MPGEIQEIRLWREHPDTRESRLRREFARSPLKNASLCESLSDGFAANANPQCKPRGLHCRVRFKKFAFGENTRTHGNLACGENTLALRLENVSLREPLSDLRAGYANPIVRSAHEMGSRRVSKKRME